MTTDTAMSSLDPKDHPIFDMKVTLGSFIIMIMGVSAIVTATWAVAGWTGNVTDRISKLEDQIVYLRKTITEIDTKLDQWHEADSDKSAVAGSPR